MFSNQGSQSDCVAVLILFQRKIQQQRVSNYLHENETIEPNKWFGFLYWQREKVQEITINESLKKINIQVNIFHLTLSDNDVDPHSFGSVDPEI